MPRAAKSKDDITDGPPVIIEETSFQEGSSDWLSNDLKILIQSPLDVQLKAILGTTDADSFLNPTIKDKKKVTLADCGISVSKKQDAHELWNILRSQSQRKLNKKEKEIPCNLHTYRNKKVSDDQVMRKIQYSRHRTELMHRVSQMNRTKTKELLKDFYLPSFDDDFSPFITEEEFVQSNETSCEHIPEKTSLIGVTLSQQHIDLERKSENQLKVRFLSEEDCSSPGKFRERMKELGVVVNSGVSIDNGYKSSSIHLIEREYKQANPLNISVALSTEPQEDQRWEPLTMVALEEHREPITGKE